MTTNESVRAIIVEDEPLAAQTLRDFIGEVAWLTCVGHAPNGEAALELVRRVDPHVVFLDVRLPVLNGLEVFSKLPSHTQVVFTTAFDHYAVSAFELGAIDYLLKPFSRARFHAAIERLRRLRSGAPPPRERFVDASALPLERLFVWKREDLVSLRDVEIIVIQADGDYARLHTGNDQYLVHVSLAQLQQRLNPARFFRVHRSTIVNVDHIVRLTKEADGRSRIVLRDGRVVWASRAGTRDLLARFQL